MGTRPGATDVVPLTSTKLETERDVALTMPHGQRFWATVRAVNKAGLHTSRSTDGIALDATPPTVGAVFDGLGPEETATQAGAFSLSASWRGFQDLESGVVAFEAGVGTRPGAADVIPLGDVGFNSSAVFEAVLKTGTTYHVTVRARNSVGLWSRPVSSDGVRVDETPPVGARCEAATDGDNLVRDPSFEHNPVRPSDSSVAGPACNAGLATALLSNRTSLPLPGWAGTPLLCDVRSGQHNDTAFAMACALNGSYPMDIAAVALGITCTVRGDNASSAEVACEAVPAAGLVADAPADGARCEVVRTRREEVWFVPANTTAAPPTTTTTQPPPQGNQSNASVTNTTAAAANATAAPPLLLRRSRWHSRVTAVRCVLSSGNVLAADLTGLRLSERSAESNSSHAAPGTVTALAESAPRPAPRPPAAIFGVAAAARGVSFSVLCEGRRPGTAAPAGVRFVLEARANSTAPWAHLLDSAAGACNASGAAWVRLPVPFVPGAGSLLPMLEDAREYRVSAVAASGEVAVALALPGACGGNESTPALALSSEVVPPVFGAWAASDMAGDWHDNGETGRYGEHR